MGFSCCRYNTEKIANELGVSEEALVNAMGKHTYGGFARVWSVKDKGNYSTARVSVSRKNKDTDAYTTDFSDGYVRLVGNAHKAFKDVKIDEKKGVGIRITLCDATNVYTSSDGKTSYTPSWTIFGLDILDSTQNKNKGNSDNSAKESGSDDFMKIPEGADEELPFD